MTQPTLPTLGRLESLPVREHLDLVAEPVARLLADWPGADGIAVVEIDPEYADTAAMSRAYDLPLDVGANCVVVIGKRAGEERIAACVVRADTRADVNGLVKRTLDVRKATFLGHDRAVAESGMEYGGITPAGLPADWRVLVDARVAEMPVALLGSGVRRSKLLVPGPLLAALPHPHPLGVEILPDLGRPGS